jgi:predicted DCC family thiol-disulfide oxidoreductase YuxK
MNLIFFDDHCSFCQRCMGMLLAWDRGKKMHFSPLEGREAERVLTGSEAYLKKENTLVLFENYQMPRQKIWTRGRGFFRILWLLGGWWSLLGWLAFCPIGINFLYRLVARYRHRYKGPLQGNLALKYRDRFLS